MHTKINISQFIIIENHVRMRRKEWQLKQPQKLLNYPQNGEVNKKPKPL